MDESGLPFKVGQLAESRSFLSGYQGAWFRSKIKKISLQKKEMMHALEFFDFPDEKVRWTKLFQKPVGGSSSKEMKGQIVVRPSFPPVYRESQMPDVHNINITEVVVIVRDAWKVGDLVDWWTDNCYWSTRLTEILGDGKARERENSHCCARLIKPANSVNQEGSQKLMVRPVEEVSKNAPPGAGVSVEYNASFSSRMSTSTLPPPEKLEHRPKRPLSPTACKETNMGFEAVDAWIGKSSYSDSVSSLHIRDATVEMLITAMKVMRIVDPQRR